MSLDRAGRKQPGAPKLGSKKSGKAAVNEHEYELAEKLGGRRQPASGALAAHKGDIKTRDFLFDSKETEATAISVFGTDLTKITREARGEGKHPGLVLTIRGVPSTTDSEWACIPLDVFASILAELENQREALRKNPSDGTAGSGLGGSSS